MNHPDSPNHDPHPESGPPNQDGSPVSPLSSDASHMQVALSSVNGGVDSLLTAQREMEAQMASLEARERIISENEQAVALERRALMERGRDIDSAHADLEGQRAALEEERRAWRERQESERASLERDLEALQDLRVADGGDGDRDLAAVEAQRAALEQAQLKLREHVAELEAAAAQRAEELAGQRRRADHLEEDLAASRDASRQLQTQLDDTAAQLAEAHTTFAQSGARGDTAGDGTGKSGPAIEADLGTGMRVRAMQQRIYRLEEELEEARREPEAPSEPASNALNEQQLASLRQKAMQLTEVAEHLRRRQRRLRAVRRRLGRTGRTERAPIDKTEAKQAAHDEFERRAKQMRQIEAARQELTAKTSELARTEKKMIRRWARSKAIVLTGWLMLLALCAGGLSWIAVDHFVPATITGAVTFEAKVELRGKLSPEKAQQWQQWHTGLLGDERFRQTLAQRMDERRLERYATLAAVNQVLDEDLTLDTTEPTFITATMAGTNADDVRAFLDIMATTVATESLRQARKRSDSGFAVVKNQRKVNGRETYTQMNATPIRDQRLYFIGPVFVVIYGVFLAIVVFMFKRLLRVKSEFDADGVMFEAARA